MNWAPARSQLRRRTFACAAAGAVLQVVMPGCASGPEDARPWQRRLRGDAVVLLGEVHDNAEHHALRLAALRRAVAGGWRPAVAMEQFDADRQEAIDQARRERPADVDHLISAATSPRDGWDWSHYRPFVALALEAGLALLAANLPRRDAMALVRRPYEAVLDGERMRAMALDPPPDADWESAQSAEIAAGHCGALPSSVIPGMARAQFARDAHMALVLRRHAGQGVVLLAGNGHVRRDIGVPRWLRPHLPPSRILSVGFLENADDVASHAFDAIVVTPAAARADPCTAFASRAG